jgi:exopolyphosphatase/pppGpp-phosphohydrolase
VAHESHALGLAARFEDYLAEHGGGEDARRQLAEQAFEIGRDLESGLLASCSEGTTAVMVGGQAGMLDRLAVEWGVWDQDAARADGIPLSLFEKVRERVVETPVETLVEMGVPEDRAPMLAGAAALYASMAARAGSRRVALPRVGLMDGLLDSIRERGRAWPPQE